jgi:hypothetical protein
MTVNAAAGTKVFIGTTAIPPNMSDLDDPSALAIFQADSYIEVGEVEDAGEYGDEASDVTFESLSDGRTRHLKGTKDAGVMPLVVGDDPEDEGQIALVAAELSPLDFNFKVVLNNALSLGGTGQVDYFYGKVMSKRQVVGTVNNVVRKRFGIGINSRIVTDPAT